MIVTTVIKNDEYDRYPTALSATIREGLGQTGLDISLDAYADVHIVMQDMRPRLLVFPLDNDMNPWEQPLIIDLRDGSVEQEARGEAE